MLQINIVYQNNNMPAEILPPIEAPDGSYTVLWSRTVLPDSDVVVYFNHYTYSRRVHERICPNALKVLYMYEPPAIDPMQYTRRVWEKFDAILTWNTYLTESSPAFTFEAGAYYDLPYCSDYGVERMTDLPDPAIRRRAICQICGDKYSLSAEEIYSERRKIARWFHSSARTRMDVFGKPPMDTPNYRGICESKAETFAFYRYALCFENTFHPLWTRGYLTEKILDCMAAGTVPVYYGCSNIQELVPRDCFIDYRDFSSLEDLDAFLQNLTDDEYLGYVERMKRFLDEYNAPQRHSVIRLYETVARVCENRPSLEAQYPKDYIATCTLSSRLRFEAMRFLLPHHRLVYPAFSVVRKIGSFLRRLGNEEGKAPK